MPRIYTSQVGANTGRSNTPLIRSSATAAAFGGNTAAALQGLGAAGQRAGSVVADIELERRERKKREEQANQMANFDATRDLLELRNEVGPDGEGYAERARETYRSKVDDYVSGIEDDDVRSNVRTNLMARLPQVSTQAEQFEFKLGADHSDFEANNSLQTLQNRVFSDPSAYENAIADGIQVIDSKGDIPAALKQGMKETLRQDIGKRRFEGLLQNAKDIPALDAIAKELAEPQEGARNWQEELLPADYTTLLNKVGSIRKQYMTSINSNAKAALQGLEQRSNDMVLLPQDELKQAQDYVRQSEDGDVKRRMAKLMSDQEFIRNNNRLPPSDLRTMKNAMMGNPNLAYPNIPPVVSNAINEASDTFGISASYLGATATREYGQFFKDVQPSSPDKYKPVALDAKLELANFSQDAVAAATQAGQILGSPVEIIASDSADVINISTLGMSDSAKIKLTNALVDAGFTGFRETEQAIGVSLDTQVPSSFGEQDGTWGGWTNLSPPIIEALKKRGFKGGLDAKAIERSSPIKQRSDIDFGMPTQIKDAAGNPTSSAVGVFQFIDSTWLSTVKDPNVAAVLGIDTTTMSDAEILDLRKDPRLSTLAGAALAYKNKKQIERATGRPASDADLYLAHFLGAGAASSFITAANNQPDQKAAALFPAQAKANRPVFYDGNRQKTVGEIYAEVSSEFTLAPSSVAYDRTQLIGKMIDRKERELANDPVQHALMTGSHNVTDIREDGGFEARGTQASAIAEYYKIPNGDMKPFTEDEAAFLQKRISEGTVDDNLEILSSINAMGTDMAKAGLKQIEAYDAAFAHAGDLYVNGHGTVASDVLRGRKRVEENPAIIDQVFPNGAQEVADAFVKETRGALFDIPPERRQAIQSAALAHYIQRSAFTGNKFKFDTTDFGQSIQAVLGARQGEAVIDTVNGSATILPEGINSRMMEDALDNMTIDDWMFMSEEGAVPRYADGAVIDPADISGEVNLRALGGGEYNVMLDDGTYLITDETTPDGRSRTFVFKPDAQRIQQISYRPRVASRSNPLNGVFGFGGL